MAAEREGAGWTDRRDPYTPPLPSPSDPSLPPPPTALICAPALEGRPQRPPRRWRVLSGPSGEKRAPDFPKRAKALGRLALPGRAGRQPPGQCLSDTHTLRLTLPHTRALARPAPT